MPGRAPAARLDLAHATLARGSAFLARSLEERAATGQSGLTGAGGAKVVGNGLRELDRFLSLLLDEAAAAVCGPEFDRPAFVRQTNVANKVDAFYRLAGHCPPSAERLRAIGRVRMCLHHCRGVVHDLSIWQDLRMAAGDEQSEAPVFAQQRLTVSFEQLDRICAFYISSGRGLLAVCSVGRALP